MYLPVLVILVTTSTVPSSSTVAVLKSIVPTTSPPTVTLTTPDVNGSPVVASVTLTFTVMLPAVVLVTSALIVASRGSTLTVNGISVALYVSSPGYEIVISLFPTSNGTTICPSSTGNSSTVPSGNFTFTLSNGNSSPVTGSVRFTLTVTLPWVALTTSVVNCD